MFESRWADIDGRVHYVEHDGPDEHPPFVLVHGLGGHHRNWMRLAPLLAERARTYALDMRGFGFTPLGTHRSTIEHNRTLVTRFVAEVAGGRAVLVGNSTGGVVSMFMAATSPDRVAGMILVDSAFPGAPGQVELLVSGMFAIALVPGLGEAFARARLRRFGFEGVQMQTLRLCTVDVTKVPPEVVEAHLDMARQRGQMPWAQVAFHHLTRSLIPTLMNRRSFTRTLGMVQTQTLMLHGTRDRLVPIQSARTVASQRPDWRFVQFGHLGHAPMLEDPEALARAVDEWLARAPLPKEAAER